MNALSVVLLVLVIGLFILALHTYRKSGRKGGCSCGCGGGDQCRNCQKGQK